MLLHCKRVVGFLFRALIKGQLGLLFIGLHICVNNFAQPNVQIAVISDIHIHNIYPGDNLENLQSLYDSTEQKIVLIRTLQSEMNSTRLFNENYFALYQALDDIGRKGIKLVIIPGDLTDDGQLINLWAVKDILSHYEERYQMRFLVTAGNHDAAPQPSESGKKDFLALDGNPLGVYSTPALTHSNNDKVYAPLREGGYRALFDLLQSFGFTPSAKDLFYTTPHQQFNYKSYQFHPEAFEFSTRLYYNGKDSLPDLTYLCEPVKDLWIMAIDGNIFERKSDGSYDNISDGYQFIQQKPFLLSWIQKMVAEARKRGKTLIAFSHYPILDFNNQQTPALKKIFGARNFQLHRVPGDSIQQYFLQTGLQLHFAGHMHINQHGYLKDEKGHQIWNIQIPSLAAFPPAYKIATINKKRVNIETIPLIEVKDYDRLFRYYKREQTNDASAAILHNSTNYYDFARAHLSLLSRQRFYNNDFSHTQWDIFKQNSPFNWPTVLNTNSLLPKQRRVLQTLNFATIVEDLYLIRNGNDLGLAVIAPVRLRLYQQWALLAKKQQKISPLDELIVIMQRMIARSISTRKTIIQLNKP